MNILVVNGPNLNLLGTREPEVYGSMTLDDLVRRLENFAESQGITMRHFQSNSEGDIIDALHEARGWADGIVINPGGYTHTSIALRDAITSVDILTIEIHISNVHAREAFRHVSMTAGACLGQISGLGWIGYQLAMQALQFHHESLG